MRYAFLLTGTSMSFAEDAELAGTSVDPTDAEIVIAAGDASYRDPTKAAIAHELGTRFLADEIGLDPQEDTLNVVGFARYRNGTDQPSPLIELVKSAWTADTAVQASRDFFEQCGFTVAVCTDQPGRIIDRLVRPKYNAALRFLDEQLATQEDMDLTCRLGLGYPDGPLERVIRGGLSYHHDVTSALFEATGQAGYAPPRAAIVANRQRAGK